MYEMNAVLWKGVQELSAKVEALETENASMRADISAMKQSLGLAWLSFS